MFFRPLMNLVKIPAFFDSIPLRNVRFRRRIPPYGPYIHIAEAH